MKIKRIHAVFLRYFFNLVKIEQIADLFYWPLLDLMVWGIMSQWVGDRAIVAPILTGIVLWQAVWRGNHEIAINLLEEFWSRNLFNLFSTPLQVGEWIISNMLLSIFKLCIALAFGVGIVKLFFGINILLIGPIFLLFVFILLFFGWSIGLITAGLIINFGHRIQMLAWMLTYMFSPFSGVFYPVEALPAWGRAIASCLPSAQVMQTMRSFLKGVPLSWDILFLTLAKTTLFFSLSLLFFLWMFSCSKSKGLARFN